MEDEQTKTPSSTVARHVAKHRALTKKQKILGLVAICLVGLFLILFAISAAVQGSGEFTVNLNFRDRDFGLSLSDNVAFTNPTSRLNAKNISDCEPISIRDFGERGLLSLDDTDGSHNGDNYFAYTFYIKNSAQKALDYSVSVNIVDTAKGVDDAIRVGIIEDSVALGAQNNRRTPTLYAKLAADGQPEPDTRPFSGTKTVYRTERRGFTPGMMHKYTVVLFLEGDDPECLDHLSGGMIRLDMQFEILEQA